MEIDAKAPKGYGLVDRVAKLTYTAKLPTEQVKLARMFRGGAVVGRDDDLDKVTVGWLESLGFEHHQSLGGCVRKRSTGGAWLSMRLINSTWCFGEHNIADQRTRADVRRLCVSVGVPLPD